MKTLAATLTLILLASAPLVAEIEKFAIPGENGLNLYWWPKLPPLTGWHHDHEHSLRYGANALAPDGFTFASAHTVIYAKAIFKPRQPENPSLAAFIVSDKKAFLSSNKGLKIAEAPSIVTADGRRLQSFTFFPSGAGNWERVTYGEEGEYYLVFTVSSRSLSGYNTALPVYAKLIGAYKEAALPLVAADSLALAAELDIVRQLNGEWLSSRRPQFHRAARRCIPGRGVSKQTRALHPAGRSSSWLGRN